MRGVVIPLQLQAVVDEMLGDLEVDQRADQTSPEHRGTERHEPKYGAGRDDSVVTGVARIRVLAVEG
jgi:hypothetical protein